MKKVVLFISMVFLLSFKTGDKKEIKIEFKGNQIQQLWQVLEFSKVNLETSTSPSIDVHNIKIMIDSLEKSVQTQYLTQVKDTIIKK